MLLILPILAVLVFGIGFVLKLVGIVALGVILLVAALAVWLTTRVE